MLKDKNTVDDINKFCSQMPKTCKKEADILSKKILQVNGYIIPEGTNTPVIMNELYDLVNSLSKLKPTDDESFIYTIERTGSDQLKQFMIKNGYNIRTDLKRKLLLYKPQKVFKDTEIVSPFN